MAVSGFFDRPSPQRAADAPSRPRTYLQESRRPLTSLLFILPLLVAYELGVLVMPTTMRNGADAWMRSVLDTLGFGAYFLLPCLTVAALLAWHHLSRQPWRIDRGVLLWMLAESAVFGVLLIGLARLHGLLFSAFVLEVAADGNAAGTVFFPTQAVGRIIAFCGAGIYEEVLFRLLLIPAAGAVASLAGLRPKAQTIVAIVGTSLLFSLAHYVGSAGDAWQLDSFLFRFSAGVFFAFLFVYRGFGITAGTHALYDVIVGVNWT